jgi:hypothetical protein
MRAKRRTEIQIAINKGILLRGGIRTDDLLFVTQARSDCARVNTFAGISEFEDLIIHD